VVWFILDAVRLDNGLPMLHNRETTVKTSCVAQAQMPPRWTYDVLLLYRVRIATTHPVNLNGDLWIHSNCGHQFCAGVVTLKWVWENDQYNFSPAFR